LVTALASAPRALITYFLLQYKPKYGYKPFPNWLTPLAHFVYFGGFCIFPQQARGTII